MAAAQVNLNPTAKGIALTRIAIAMALGGDGPEQAATIARKRWGEGAVSRIFDEGGPRFLQTKANVSAGATLSGNWAETLVSLESAATEFFGLVRERSLLGKIAGLRRIPLRTRLVNAATGFSAAWVGEGKAKPISSATYDDDTLPPLKVVAMTVVTKELLASVDPAAELLIRNDLVNACVEAINASFIDPANGGETDVEPASITNGAPSIAASGDGLQDLRELIAAFPGELERAVLIGSPQTFAVMHDPLFIPGLGVRGGEAIGIPAIAAPAAGSTLALIDPDGIAIGEAEMDLRTSTEGTIEMRSDPTQDATTPTPANQVSLWQTDSAAIMAEKRLNWRVARPSVVTVTGVAPS